VVNWKVNVVSVGTNKYATSDGRPLSSSRIRRGEIFHEDDLIY